MRFFSCLIIMLLENSLLIHSYWKSSLFDSQGYVWEFSVLPVTWPAKAVTGLPDLNLSGALWLECSWWTTCDTMWEHKVVVPVSSVAENHRKIDKWLHGHIIAYTGMSCTSVRNGAEQNWIRWQIRIPDTLNPNVLWGLTKSLADRSHQILKSHFQSSSFSVQLNI